MIALRGLDVTETMTEVTHAAQADKQGPGKIFDARMVFFFGLLLAGSGLVSPPVALVGGIAFGFTVVHPYRREARGC